MTSGAIRGCFTVALAPPCERTDEAVAAGRRIKRMLCAKKEACAATRNRCQPVDFVAADSRRKIMMSFAHVLSASYYFCNTGYMESTDTIAALAALAQPTRLETFRLLVRQEPEGIAAGELASLLAVPQNTMSAHLGVLSRCGLVVGERRSRSIIYRADLARFRAVVTFLLKDCCDGKPEICAPLIAELAPCCSSKEPACG
jgi:DNA-binding transcriptional ArsR family regulator